LESPLGEPPCHRCRALCCRGFTTIPVYPDRYTEDATLVDAGYVERQGAHWTLPRADGRCVYLDDTTNLCLIHDERPRACRDYDCRVPWAARNLLAMLAQQGIDASDSPPLETAREDR
jgi:Fe-S-cluster containining protein